MATPMWTTQNEIAFIKHLGKGKWSVDSLAVKEAGRARLLALYLAGAEKRDNWDDIDRDEVLSYVRGCIVDEVRN